MYREKHERRGRGGGGLGLGGWVVALLCLLVVEAYSGGLEEFNNNTNITNATNITNLCIPCKPGTISTEGCGIPVNESKVVCNSGFCAIGSHCTVCPSGFFQNMSWQSSCKPCTPGFYAPYEGSTNCSECTISHYCPYFNTTIPLICDNGYYCPRTGLYVQIPCPPGYKCIGIGHQYPDPCPPGFLCKGGDALPEACPKNTFCGSTCTQCVPCPNGPFMVSDPGSERCTASVWLIVAIGVACVVLITMLVFGVFYVKKHRALKKQKNSEEITNLIPRAQGPAYGGF